MSVSVSVSLSLYFYVVCVSLINLFPHKPILKGVCEVLLDRGANINYEMPRGRFTGQMATTGTGGKGGKGGWYSAKNMEIGNGATSLHAAVENGHPTVVKVLLDRGATQGKRGEGDRERWRGGVLVYLFSKCVFVCTLCVILICSCLLPPSSCHYSLFLSQGRVWRVHHLF